MMITVIARLLIVAFAFLTLAEAQRRFAPHQSMIKALRKINDVRRELAKNISISNMHEVSWDDELAEASAKLSCHWPPAYSGPGRVMMVFHSKQLTSDQKKVDDPEHPLYRFMESLVHPLQTKIGCSDLICDIPTPKIGTIKADGWCVMGPFSWPPKNHIKWGLAGSECGLLENDDGLCISPGSASGRSGSRGSRYDGSESSKPEESDSSDSKEEDTIESTAFHILIALPLMAIFSVQLVF